MRDRIVNILKALNAGAYERTEAIALSLLAGLSGESIFMLGLPGVGKSMLARRLKLAFNDAKVFEYLMSRFSTPDEIFGPVSISKLKNDDCYERITAGYLPEAEIVFLDEIWKAGPAIQNSLLTVLNEKIFLNGNREMHLPVKAVIAASNELPAEGEGLEALWDRFLLRYIVKPIQRKDNFFKLLDYDSDERPEIDIRPISNEEYSEILNLSRKVIVPRNIKELMYMLRQRLQSEANTTEQDDIDEDKPSYYVSDRRWRKAVGVMKTSAFLNGREEVTLSDTLILDNILWNSDAEIPKLRCILAESLVAVLLADILSTYNSVKGASSTHVGKKRQSENDKPYTKDNVHYEIICDEYILKIRIVDYDMMKRNPTGFYFASESTDGRLVIRPTGQYSVRVIKPGYVCINNYSYQLAMANGSHLTAQFFKTVDDDIRKLEANLIKDIDYNIFTKESSVRPVIRKALKEYRKRFSVEE